MYKVIVVDDEIDARNRVKSMLCMLDLDLSIVGEYDNGLDAKNAILNDPPDILITDIKIPYIDGIELSKIIYEHKCMTKIIIISGYDVFDYAKNALDYGVAAFITKPFILSDIKKNLEKVITMIDSEFSLKSTLNKLNEFQQNNMSIVIEHNLSKLVNSKSIDNSFLEELIEDGIEVNKKNSFVSVIDFDKTDNELDYNLHEAVRYKIDEHLSNNKSKIKYHTFFRSNKVIVLGFSDEEITKQFIEKEFESVLFILRRVFNLTFTIGISKISNAGKDTNFRELYSKSCNALDYRNVIGGDQIIFYDDILYQEYKFLTLDETVYKQLIYLLNYESLDKVYEYLGSIFAKISTDEYKYSSYYISLNILNTVIKGCNSLSHLYKQFMQHNEIIHIFSKLKTPEEILEFIKKVAYEVYQVNQNLKANILEKYYYKIIMYIDEHYNEFDISLDKLSEDINLSASYISSLLKKHNTTFVKYLTNLRIEKAKELLKDPSNKIVEIAKIVGYLDPYYFSNCFKKYTGLSPKEYRNEENKQ